jgi:hypothetical protein
MGSERDELIRRVKRLDLFSCYVEQAMKLRPESPEDVGFWAALQLLQEEMQIFDEE